MRNDERWDADNRVQHVSGYVEKVKSNISTYLLAIVLVSPIHTVSDLNIISVDIKNTLTNMPKNTSNTILLISPPLAIIPITRPYKISPKAEKLHWDVNTFNNTFFGCNKKLSMLPVII